MVTLTHLGKGETRWPMVPLFELGLDTFGDVTADAAGRLLPHAQVIRNVVEEGVLADQLGVEKLDLFAPLLTQEPVTWHGRTRAALTTQRVFPTIESGSLKTWIGVGGSPESVVRAARYGMPMMLAIIGGDPKRFKPYVELYHRTLEQLGKPTLPIGVHSPGHIAQTDAQAKDELWPAFKIMRDRIGAERGWGPISRPDFDQEADRGSLYCGSPETVARRIAATAKTLGIARFDLKYSAGPLSHEKLMHSIELYGSRVIPLVREILA